MADLHARLLAELDDNRYDSPTEMRLAGGHRAVVKLHAPVPCGYSSCRSPETHRVCKMCGPGINADQCSTIRTIAEALGVPTEGGGRD